jgi:hypothetical protein
MRAQPFGVRPLSPRGNMIHPFMPDISDKSLDELQASITDLSIKLSFAYRINNQSLINQLLMVIEGYRNEYNSKMDEVFARQNIETRISVEKE